MVETIYDWGTARRRARLPGVGPDRKVKLPPQSTITDRGLVPNSIPMYEAPAKPATMSRGFLDYDPLEDF